MRDRDVLKERQLLADKKTGSENTKVLVGSLKTGPDHPARLSRSELRVSPESALSTPPWDNRSPRATARIEISCAEQRGGRLL